MDYEILANLKTMVNYYMNKCQEWSNINKIWSD